MRWPTCTHEGPYLFSFWFGGGRGGGVPFLWILVFSAMFLIRPHFHLIPFTQKWTCIAHGKHFYTYILGTIAQCFCDGPIKVAPWKVEKKNLAASTAPPPPILHEYALMKNRNNNFGCTHTPAPMNTTDYWYPFNMLAQGPFNLLSVVVIRIQIYV